MMDPIRGDNKVLSKFDLYIKSLNEKEVNLPKKNKKKRNLDNKSDSSDSDSDNDISLNTMKIYRSKYKKKKFTPNIVNELENILSNRKDGNTDMPELNDKSDDDDEISTEYNKDNLLLSMISSADNTLFKKCIKKIIHLSNDKTLIDIIHLVETKNSKMEYNINDAKIINYTNINHIKEKLLIMVKEIKSIMIKHMWTQQKELSGLLVNRVNGRAIVYDHTLAMVNTAAERSECSIGKIPNINYKDYINNYKDIITNTEDVCDCKTTDAILDCSHCKDMINNIASRSCGDCYDSNNIPKWNMTFASGALRSRYRVFYGSYNMRLKTELNSNCLTKVSISLINENDPLLSEVKLHQEISILFESQYKKKIFLLLKSQDKPEIQRIPIRIDEYKYDRSEYNNYTVKWNSKEISIFVNDKLVYKTKTGEKIPLLPGYSTMGVIPNYDTNSYQLLQKIDSGNRPNLKIKHFEYIKDFSEL
jgi:hypothetical protein